MGITLHPGQLQVENDEHQFVIVKAGRQWGKSVYCRKKVIEGMFSDPNRPTYVGWVMPTNKQCRLIFSKIRDPLEKAGLLLKSTKTDLEIQTINGSVLFFMSGEAGDSNRGATLDLAVLDEARYLPQGFWESVIMPMLAVHEGRAYIISTPKGKKNWFARLCHGATENPDGIYGYHHFGSANSPYFSQMMFDEMSRNMPEHIMKQELYAEELEDGGNLFGHFLRCTRDDGSWMNYNSLNHYVGGLDIANEEDYTFAIIGDVKTRQAVDVYRNNKVTYSILEEDIVRLSRRWGNPLLFADSTQHRDFCDRLRNRGLNISEYHFAGAAGAVKRRLIESLILAIQNVEIHWPQGTELHKHLENEFDVYEMNITPAGNISYGASQGYHDDAITALALMNHGFGRIISGCGGLNEDTFNPREIGENVWDVL